MDSRRRNQDRRSRRRLTLLRRRYHRLSQPPLPPPRPKVTLNTLPPTPTRTPTDQPAHLHLSQSLLSPFLLSSLAQIQGSSILVPSLESSTLPPQHYLSPPLLDPSRTTLVGTDLPRRLPTEERKLHPKSSSPSTTQESARDTSSRQPRLPSQPEPSLLIPRIPTRALVKAQETTDLPPPLHHLNLPRSSIDSPPQAREALRELSLNLPLQTPQPRTLPFPPHLLMLHHHPHLLLPSLNPNLNTPNQASNLQQPSRSSSNKLSANR